VLAGFGTLPVLLIGLFLAYSFLGVVVPSAMVAALDAHGRRAGMASSLSGSLTMLTGAFVSLRRRRSLTAPPCPWW
jgi:DHA1 family bicyclomycin/chloramphenicol resistance-like MFS transporter